MPVAMARLVPIAQAYEPPQHRCIALAAEGMHFYEKAVEFDRAGNVKEAAFYFNRAVPKLAEAGQLCPNGHPDKQALADLSQDIPLRVVYLESLAGAHATVLLEDHIGEVSLLMDLSSPPPAGEEQAQVSELLARSGISGSAADLSDEGLRLVRALEKQSELRVFVDRMLVSDGRRRTAAATPNDVDACIAAAPSFDGLFKSLRLQPWVELNIDEKADRLDVANRYQDEGVKLETQGERQAAAVLYSRASALFQFLSKHDPRAKQYAKVREMMEQRVQALNTKIAELGGAPGG